MDTLVFFYRAEVIYYFQNGESLLHVIQRMENILTLIGTPDYTEAVRLAESRVGRPIITPEGGI
jgi:hypothetical protein